MAPSTRKSKGKSVTTAAELAAAGDLDADSDFASSSLSAVDSSLRCAICSELYTAPVILNHCGHSFDSRCLAEHFVVKRDCPTCHREAFHDHTVRNQALSELVESWRAARSDLLDLQARAARNASPEAGPSHASITPHTKSVQNGTRTTSRASNAIASKNGYRKATSSSSPAPTVKREVLEDASSDIEILDETPIDRKPSKRPRTRSATPPAADLTDPNLMVACPLCGRFLKNGLMSGHLDRCTGEPSTSSKLAAGSSQAWSKLMATSNGSRAGGTASGRDGASSSAAGAPEMDLSKKLPLGSYQHKKAAQLVKMLKDYGLPTDSPNGLSSDAKVAHLQRRHRQFVILWNANADLDPDHPARKTAKQLRSELKHWEEDQDRAEGKGEIADDHATRYAEQYRELIAQARASHEKAKRAKEQAVAAAVAGEPEAAALSDPAAAVALEDEAPTVHEATPQLSTTERKKSVRVVSPARSSSSPAGEATETRAALEDSASTGSSPLLPSSPLRTSLEDDDSMEDAASAKEQSSRRRKRTPSPFDPAGPRPSQRNREEERMFARLRGEPAEEMVQMDEDDSFDASADAAMEAT
ncbi:hypothetical protein JCM10908_004211 [Rhodotorula pacifica]|uniref:uncharacterized protein n=1 Tax=Rhodotorula pacifica TaxID=1495444 RepID=UPI00317AA2EF